MAELVTKSDQSVIQTAKAPRNRSKFDLSHHHLTTLRFGEIFPFFNMEAVNNDKITLRSKHDLSTFTLKSPILSNIRMRKDYFSVPMEAILPFNWDKIITNPMFGDDVDADTCNCVIDLSKLSSFFASITSSISSGQFQTKQLRFLNCLSILELIFSSGSLPSRLGYNFSNYVSIKVSNEDMSLDSFIDFIYQKIRETNPNFSLQYYDDSYGLATKSFDVSTASGLRLFHDFALTHVFAAEKDAQLISNDLFNFSNLEIKFLFVEPNASNLYFTKYNIAPVAAYQICIAHYMSNDKVDYIYSAELYRQLMHNLSDDYAPTFDYNGVRTPYDYLSGYYIAKTLSNLTGSTPDTKSVKAILYIQNLFGICRSLRYVDYFTSAN